MNKILPFLFLASLSLGACSSDDDDQDDLVIEAASIVLFDGQELALDNGFMQSNGVNFGTDGEPIDSYSIEIYLTTSAVSYDASSMDFKGDGGLISLDLNTSEESELSSGTYTFSAEKGDREAFVLSGGEIFKDYDASLQADKGDEEELIGGTVKVVVENDKYIFTIDLATENSTLKGTFNGALQSI